MGEKRREKRNSRKIPARIVEGAGSRPAVTRDISGHGLKVCTTRDLAVTEKVTVLLDTAAPQPLQVEGTVCWRSADVSGDSIELGLRLDSAPPDFFDLLLALPAGGLEERLRHLSAMPLLILDLMAIVNDPASSVRHIEEKIKSDQAMAAYLLKSVNSSFYSLPKPAASVRQAIQVTGFAALKSLLLSYFTRQITYLAGDRQTQQRLWHHALAVALTTREAARAAGVDEEAAYTAGLLHDIGKAVLLAAEPATYLPVLRETLAVAQPSLRVEGRLLGYSHVEAGLYVMARWNFSELQRQVVSYHHRPRAYPGANPVVHLAAYANQLLHRREGREPDADELCPRPPGLQRLEDEALLERALGQMEPLS